MSMRQLNVLPFAIVESLGHDITLPVKDKKKNALQKSICCIRGGGSPTSKQIFCFHDKQINVEI